MHRATVAVLCLVQFVDVLGVTSAVTAIPSILHGLHADPAWAGPIATTYAMFFAGMLVLGARLGDRYGHRRILLLGIVLFAVVSVIGGTATGVPQVLAGRAVQGAAAAVSAPSALRLLLATAPDERARTGALSAWSAFGATAGAAGFLVGGVLVDALGWPFVFWINAPVGAVLLVGVLLTVPRESAPEDRTILDVPGAILLIACMLPVIAGAALLERAPTRLMGWILLALGIVIAAGFVLRMRTARAPLIPSSALASRELRRGTVQSFVNTAGTSSSLVLASLVMQDRMHLSPLASGLTLMAASGAVIIGSIGTPRIARRAGTDRLAAAGLALIAVANAVFALGTPSWWSVLLGGIVLGAGLAPASVAANDVGTVVAPALTGSAAGILNTGAQLGAAIGTAAAVLVASLAGDAVGWGVLALASLACAVWCALRRPSMRPAPDPV